MKRYIQVLLLFVCLLLAGTMVRSCGNQSEKAAIREKYAAHSLTFPSGQTLTALLAETPSEQVTGDQHTWTSYAPAAIAPYLPEGTTPKAVQTAPYVGEDTYYITYTTAQNEEVCLVYRGDRLLSKTVYDPVTDCAYEITDKNITIYDHFYEGATTEKNSLFSVFSNLFRPR